PTSSGVRGVVQTRERDQTTPVPAKEFVPTPPHFKPRRPPRMDLLTAPLLILTGGVLVVIILVFLTTTAGPGSWLAGLVCGGLLLFLVAGISWLVRLVWRGLREDPQTALLRAAENGQVERIKKLIRQGVALEVRDEMGET